METGFMKSKLLSLFLMIFAGNVLCDHSVTKESLHKMSLVELQDKCEVLFLQLKSKKEIKKLRKQINHLQKLKRKHKKMVLKSQDAKNDIIILWYISRVAQLYEKIQLQLIEIQQAVEKVKKMNPDLALLVECIFEKERVEEKIKQR